MKGNLIASLLFVCAGLGATQGSGSPCSGTPCNIPNLFDPDLADLKSYNNQALEDFTKGALDKTKGSTNDKDGSCHPLPISITVITKPIPDDPKLQALIADSRMEALVTYFKAQGLDPQNVEQVKATGPQDKVQGMYSDDVDRDPPVLKVTSTPPRSHGS